MAEEKTNEQVKKNFGMAKSLIAVFLSLLIIILGKMWLKIDTTIVLLLSAFVVSVFVMICGIKWDDIQAQIGVGVKQMGIPIIILMETGILVGAWMISGTIPTMMYYGLQILNPKFFLVLTCLICTVMSVASGTSWGTLSTVGIALLGVSIGLKIPLPYVAGAIVVGSFFGDKMSPLSDSTIVAAASCDVPLIEHVKHMLYTTVPAYVISLLLFLFLGFQFDGSIAGEEYSLILTTLEKTFDMNIFMIIPPILVFVLIIMKKPAIPVFAIGILSAAILAVIFQGQDVTAVASTLASGCKLDTGEELVNTLVQRGGMSSMMSTVGIVLGAAVFGAPIRASGAAETIFGKVAEKAKSPKMFMILCTIMHPIFMLIAVTYYVTYPVMGSMVGPVYEKYGLSKANLTRTFEDTGTIIAPLIPWGMAGAFITGQLNITPDQYWMYMPLCWLCAVFGIICILTGIGIKKTDGTMVTPILHRKKKAKADT